MEKENCLLKSYVVEAGVISIGLRLYCDVYKDKSQLTDREQIYGQIHKLGDEVDFPLQ